MKQIQIALLFGTMLVNFMVGLGVLPFLPIYASTGLGVAPDKVGIFLSILSIALTAGTIGGGWLGEKFKRRKLLIQIGSVIGFPSFFLISFVTNIWQLTLLACIAWFAIGMGTTMVRVIGGIIADESERGRVFGILGAATPLAALVSGLIGGRIVDLWGMSTLFQIVSLSFLLQFVMALFLQEVSARDHHQTPTDAHPAPQNIALGLPFWFVVCANLICFVSISGAIMGRPLLMDELGFDGTAIAGVLVPGALVAFPMSFIVGWLSDIFGRKTLLMLTYLLPTIGMVILVFSNTLWYFWISEMMLAFIGVSIVVSSALIADIVAKEGLDKALANFSAAASIGTIIGYIIVGYFIDIFGLTLMFGISAALMFVAALMVIPIQVPKRKIQPAMSGD